MGDGEGNPITPFTIVYTPTNSSVTGTINMKTVMCNESYDVSILFSFLVQNNFAEVGLLKSNVFLKSTKCKYGSEFCSFLAELCYSLPAKIVSSGKKVESPVG